MPLQTEWVRYGEKQEYSGYVAHMDRIPGQIPAVVVIQEIWGVDSHIVDVANRFAQAGYVAFAPDLYTLNGERTEPLQAERVSAVKAFLETIPPAAWNDPAVREAAFAARGEEGKQMLETFGTLFGEVARRDYTGVLTAATSFLRVQYAASKGEGVASVGFCMGGRLSGQLACHDPQLRGAVIFYGDAPAKDAIAGIQCPVRGFYGAQDPRITNQVPDLAANMQTAGKSFEYQIYEGAGHAFFNDSRSSYHVGAMRDSFARTLSFFADVLG